MRHMGMILAAGLFAVIGMTGMGSEANGDWRTAYAEIIKAPEAWLDTSEPVNGWNFELLDLDENGTPELVGLESIGARGITGDIYVFGYDGTGAVEYTVENDIGFSILGDCKEYRNQITGQKEWLMNLERFRGDSIQPGGYLESSAGQGGIAGLIFKPEEKKAIVYALIDSEKKWGITAEDAGAVLVREPWGENCITEEAYDKIQNFIGQYEDLGDAPSVYIGHGNTNTTTENEIYSMLNSFSGAENIYIIHTGETFLTEEAVEKRQEELGDRGIITLIWEEAGGYKLVYECYHTRCLAERRVDELRAEGNTVEIEIKKIQAESVSDVREILEVQSMMICVNSDEGEEDRKIRDEYFGEPLYRKDGVIDYYEGIDLFGISGSTFIVEYENEKVSALTWEMPQNIFTKTELNECMNSFRRSIGWAIGERMYRLYYELDEGIEEQDSEGNTSVTWYAGNLTISLVYHKEGYLSSRVELME